MIGAFGDEARKQALLQAVRDEDATYKLWLTYDAVEGDLSPISRDFSLHPAFVKIMPVLGGYGQDDAKTFYLSAIEALPVGGDAAAAVRRWFLFAWDEPTYGLSQKLKGAVQEPAQAIIDLVRASIDQPVDKATWRKARARLSTAQDSASEDSDMSAGRVNAVLSMAWDLDLAPGSAGDVVDAWGAPVMWESRANSPDGLKQEENELLSEHMRKAHEAAMAQLGELTKDAEGRAAYEKATDAYWAAQPEVDALRQRMYADMKRGQAAHAAWRSVAQGGLVAALAAAPQAVAA